jgi:transcriptional regulator with XRE-family HTH domain
MVRQQHFDVKFFFSVISGSIRRTMNIEFGRWLANQRRRAGMTQKDVATKCHLSDPYITRLELGSIDPPPRTTCKLLARAMGVRFEEVWRAAFAARLTRWLRREGYSGITEGDLLEVIEKIETASR